MKMKSKHFRWSGNRGLIAEIETVKPPAWFRNPVRIHQVFLVRIEGRAENRTWESESSMGIVTEGAFTLGGGPAAIIF